MNSFNFNVSDIQFEILDLLVGKNGMYGLEMVKASSKLKRATIYVHLSRMEDKNWLRSEAIETGEPGMARRRYYVTGEGQRVYRAALAANAIRSGDFGGALA